jgi:hypothetical protein
LSIRVVSICLFFPTHCLVWTSRRH